MKKMYWTIASVLMFGLLFGSILTQKYFEPRMENEIITFGEKAYMLLGIFLYSLSFYLAGTEYHNQKKKLKTD